MSDSLAVEFTNPSSSINAVVSEGYAEYRVQSLETVPLKYGEDWAAGMPQTCGLLVSLSASIPIY